MTCKRADGLPLARTLTAERLRLLDEGQALKERLRELGKGHRDVMQPRYYAVWRLLGRQQEAVERGEVPDWTTIQPTAVALIEYNGIQSAMVCELHKTMAAYMSVAEMALQITDQEIEARAEILVEERTAVRTVVVTTPLLAQ
jgi:hypothetical protein